MSGDTTPVLALLDEHADLQARFVPGAGMLCSSVLHGGQELLAQNAGVAAYARHGTTMGIPLLYPWANRLAGFRYSVGDREVEVPRDPALVAVDQRGLPIHGVIGGRLAWDAAVETGDGGASLEARLRWDESTPELMEVFPFRHLLTYRARLARGRLELQLTIDACLDDPVPVAFGFHPYLAPGPGPREGWQIELPAMRRLATDDRQIPTGPAEAVPAERFELGDRTYDDGFDSLAEHAGFAVSSAERRVELELDEGYPCAQVFAPAASRFICFEPMVAPANALCSGSGLRVLEPGGRFRAAFAVDVANLRAAKE